MCCHPKNHFAISQTDIGYQLTNASQRARQAPARSNSGHRTPAHDAPVASEPPPPFWNRRRPLRLGLWFACGFVAALGGCACAIFGVVPVASGAVIGGLLLAVFVGGFARPK